jgi:hypothetical protein
MEHNRVVPWFVVPFFKPWIGLVWMVGLGWIGLDGWFSI